MAERGLGKVWPFAVCPLCFLGLTDHCSFSVPSLFSFQKLWPLLPGDVPFGRVLFLNYKGRVTPHSPQQGCVGRALCRCFLMLTPHVLAAVYSSLCLVGFSAITLMFVLLLLEQLTFRSPLHSAFALNWFTLKGCKLLLQSAGIKLKASACLEKARRLECIFIFSRVCTI